MKHTLKDIKNVLIILEAAAEKKMEKWTEPKPATQKDSFKKVTDSGEHEMDEEPKFDSVGDKEPKAINTKPTFPKVNNGGIKGGATGEKGSGKAKEVKLTENAWKLKAKVEEITGKRVMFVEAEELDEESRNARLLKTGSPALKEDIGDNRGSKGLINALNQHNGDDDLEVFYVQLDGQSFELLYVPEAREALMQLAQAQQDELSGFDTPLSEKAQVMENKLRKSLKK